MNSIFSLRFVVDSSSRLTKLLTNPTTHRIHHHHQSFTSLYRPNQSRHFRTHYLPWTALRNNSTKLGNLVESGVVFFGSRFPKKGLEIEGFSGSQRRGWKEWLQGLSANDVVLGLVVANTGVFLMWQVFDKQFMINNFMISLDNVTGGRIHTLITSAFSHFDLGHIISNMIGLYFFGNSIARSFSPQFLLKLYLAGALGGSVFYLIHHAYMAATSPKGQGAFTKDPSRNPGLVCLNSMALSREHGLSELTLDFFIGCEWSGECHHAARYLPVPNSYIYFDFVIPVPAMLLGVFFIGKDILRILEGNSNISGSAHLGGAAVAAIAWARIRRGRFSY
ncbi:unnamed protein product [Arabis nemorensis]|uniref:Peptidase S54 rhomboid domain-containing protein n=1 Tax=Arabis nemorensis TaxID=586526 RepID=A0A565AXK2_9BRAS|nr:unnamed protein product [Arabis nemorensis]